MGRKSNKKKTGILLLGFAFVLALLGIYNNFFEGNKSQSKATTETEFKTPVTTTTQPKKQETKPVVKETASLPVPFTLQGPLDNLNIHEESCEEAAALMYHYYLEGQYTFDGSTVIPKQRANDEMIVMKNWQVKNYGVEPDLSIEKLGQFMRDYYGYKYKVYKNITKDDIKREISLGNPVMVPVMTHSLKNPMYGAQTTYHILVIKGYNVQNAITNDAGVRGENQQYSWDILFGAIDAQTPKMNQGREMVVITK